MLAALLRAGRATSARKAPAMKKAIEYRQHAADCRALAAQMDLGEHRDQLLRMAAAWEELAHDRDRMPRARDDEIGSTVTRPGAGAT